MCLRSQSKDKRIFHDLFEVFHFFNTHDILANTYKVIQKVIHDIEICKTF